MSTVINLRGTNASGKSTIVRKVIDTFGGTPIYYKIGEQKWLEPAIVVTIQDGKKVKTKVKTNKIPLLCKKDRDIKGYLVSKEKTGLDKDLYVVGPYRTPTGGCDTIGTGEAARNLVTEWSQKGHVLYEGLLISGLFEKYNILADELASKGHNHIFAFLDTPLETCIKQVFQRQAERGVKKDFDPEKTQVPKYHAILIARRKFEAANSHNCECCKVKPCKSNKKDVRTLPHQTGFATVMEWFSHKANHPLASGG